MDKPLCVAIDTRSTAVCLFTPIHLSAFLSLSPSSPVPACVCLPVSLEKRKQAWRKLSCWSQRIVCSFLVCISTTLPPLCVKDTRARARTHRHSHSSISTQSAVNVPQIPKIQTQQSHIPAKLTTVIIAGQSRSVKPSLCLPQRPLHRRDLWFDDYMGGGSIGVGEVSSPVDGYNLSVSSYFAHKPHNLLIFVRYQWLDTPAREGTSSDRCICLAMLSVCHSCRKFLFWRSRMIYLKRLGTNKAIRKV